jgi:hypothetical protein
MSATGDAAPELDALWDAPHAASKRAIAAVATNLPIGSVRIADHSPSLGSVDGRSCG